MVDPIDEILRQLNELTRAVLALRRSGVEQVSVAPSAAPPPSVTLAPQVSVAGDILRGASAIAVFLYGDANQRRKIYHLAAMGGLPTFKVGAIICARKSEIVQRIKAQEARSHGAPRTH